MSDVDIELYNLMVFGYGLRQVGQKILIASHQYVMDKSRDEEIENVGIAVGSRNVSFVFVYSVGR